MNEGDRAIWNEGYQEGKKAKFRTLHAVNVKLKKALKVARDEIGYEGCWEGIVQDKIDRTLRGE